MSIANNVAIKDLPAAVNTEITTVSGVISTLSDAVDDVVDDTTALSSAVSTLTASVPTIEEERIHLGANYYGPSNKLIEPPAIANLTFVNQGTATASKTNGVITFRTPFVNSTSIKALVEPIPSRPFKFRVGLKLHGLSQSYQQGGIVLQDSVSGKMAFFAIIVVGGSTSTIIQLYNSPTSHSSSEVYGGGGRTILGVSDMYWMQWELQAGSGNRIPSIGSSRTGVAVPFATMPAWDNFFAPTHAGVAIECNGNNINDTVMTVHSWEFYT